MCHFPAICLSWLKYLCVSVSAGSRTSVIPCLFFTFWTLRLTLGRIRWISAILADSILYPISLNSFLVENLLGWKETACKDSQTFRGRVNHCPYTSRSSRILVSKPIAVVDLEQFFWKMWRFWSLWWWKIHYRPCCCTTVPWLGLSFL